MLYSYILIIPPLSSLSSSINSIKLTLQQLNNSHRRSRPTRHAELPDWSIFLRQKKEKKKSPAMPLESESLEVSQMRGGGIIIK